MRFKRYVDPASGHIDQTRILATANKTASHIQNRVLRSWHARRACTAFEKFTSAADEAFQSQRNRQPKEIFPFASKTTYETETIHNSRRQSQDQRSSATPSQHTRRWNRGEHDTYKELNQDQPRLWDEKDHKETIRILGIVFPIRAQFEHSKL